MYIVLKISACLSNSNYVSVDMADIFRWFKFTLKPPYSIVIGNFFSAIWDTSHWNLFVKFGLNTPYDIS